jgi:hypothetical protein
MSAAKHTTASSSGVSHHSAPASMALPAARAATWPKKITLRVAIRPASRAATNAATVMPPA